MSDKDNVLPRGHLANVGAHVGRAVVEEAVSVGQADMVGVAARGDEHGVEPGVPALPRGAACSVATDAAPLSKRGCKRSCPRSTVVCRRRRGHGRRCRRA
eukprot:7387796-Prymnesium_polylepis.2